jgi:tellurite methyltransferase
MHDFRVFDLEGEPDPLILDVREEAAFALGHLPGSGHLPEGDWLARRSELPPRDRAVLVVAATPARSHDAALRLGAMGYSRAHALDVPIESLAATLDTAPARPLWRPAPALVRAIDRHGARIPSGPVADLACGSGRDAVWLAQRGFDVEAWDHAPEALERARQLAAACGVSLRRVPADLERGTPPLPASRYALITCFRFLHRPLLPAMAAALVPGGILVYETFRVGQERYGRPTHAQFLLANGELREAFRSLEMLEYEEVDHPGGPITAKLVARRPA